MINLKSRREFFRTGLAAGVFVAGGAASAEAFAEFAAQAPAVEGGAGFEVFTKQAVAGMVSELEASPAAREIVPGKGMAISMTVSAEAGKIAKEFEMHEHRDHVFQVLDGTTTYQIGGTLKGGRQTKPGEWLAPEAEGFKTIVLNTGDYLTIPRGTPHRRMTQGKVSLLLINTMPPA